MRNSLSIIVFVLAGLLTFAPGSIAEQNQRPDVGDFVPSYASTKCAGIDDGVPVGKTVCYTCRAGSEPIFYVFTKKQNDSLINLVKQIEALVVARKDKKAAAVINFLGDPASEEARKNVADFGSAHQLRDVTLTVTADGSKFHLGEQDETTVILFADGIIRLRTGVGADALDQTAIDSIIRRSKALLD